MSTPPSLDSLPGTSEFTQMPLQRLKRRGPWKNFGVYTGIIGIGIASYLLVLILIVVPGVCESTSIHEKTQQTVKIIHWDAQFVSERFCQCYESDALWKQFLPMLSITFFAFVVILLVWLNMAYDKHRQDQSWVTWFYWSNIACIILGSVSWVFYAILVLFTHRKICNQIECDFEWSTWHDEDIHFTSTGLFFVTFFLLWLVVLTENYITDYTSFNGKLRHFHLFLISLFVVEVGFFFYFAKEYVENPLGIKSYQGAITLEYIIFLTLFLQCSFCLFCVPIYHTHESKLREQISNEGEGEAKHEETPNAPLLRNGVLITYVTLNTDIL